VYVRGTKLKHDFWIRYCRNVGTGVVILNVEYGRKQMTGNNKVGTLVAEKVWHMKSGYSRLRSWAGSVCTRYSSVLPRQVHQHARERPKKRPIGGRSTSLDDNNGNQTDIHRPSILPNRLVGRWNFPRWRLFLGRCPTRILMHDDIPAALGGLLLRRQCQPCTPSHRLAFLGRPVDDVLLLTVEGGGETPGRGVCQSTGPVPYMVIGGA
jgi:hypothetical protein